MSSEATDQAILSRLRPHAISEGEQWALALRRELVRDGRAVAGGWPGTMTEAVTKVRCRLIGDAPREQEWELAQAMYHAAREAWFHPPIVPIRPRPQGGHVAATMYRN